MTRKITPIRIERAKASVEMARTFPATLLATDAVLMLTSWSVSTLHRKCREGEFPRPVGRGRWSGGEVLKALESVTAAQ